MWTTTRLPNQTRPLHVQFQHRASDNMGKRVAYSGIRRVLHQGYFEAEPLASWTQERGF